MTTTAFLGAAAVYGSIYEKKQSAEIERYAAGRWDQALESRGYLQFDRGAFSNTLYAPSLPKNATTIVPFFENPRINEKRQALYASHNIFARNEPIRLWVGSDPITVSLKFSYTAPHAALYARQWLSLSNDDENDAVRKYLNDILIADLWEDRDYAERFSENTDDNNGVESVYTAEVSSKFLSPRGNNPKLDSLTDIATRIKTLVGPSPTSVDVFLHRVINDIRGCVIGGTGELFKYSGPPVCKLKYGTLFDSVPMIVKDYKIDFDSEKGGVDPRTLFPNIITFELTLQSYYQTEDQPLPGWNSIIQKGGL